MRTKNSRCLKSGTRNADKLSCIQTSHAVRARVGVALTRGVRDFCGGWGGRASRVGNRSSMNGTEEQEQVRKTRVEAETAMVNGL